MSALAELSGLERGGTVLDSGLAYGDGEAVEVFVPVVEGRDIGDLVVRLADASRAVHEALLALEDHGL